MTRITALALLTPALALVLCAACSDDSSTTADTGIDAGQPPADGGPGTDTGPNDGGSDAGPATDAGPSLFTEGCPGPGLSVAKKITGPNLKAHGPDALGTVGDYLLMNSQAAFVVQGSGHVNTYYYYDGILIDGVAIDNCAQAGEERFEELWLLFGRLNATEFASSILRAFRGDTFEIANDGADGKAAVVKVTGADDVFWLVEDELIRSSFDNGKPKQLSQPFGVEVEVSYILPPDSRVLQMNITYRNKSAAAQSFLAGAAAQFGDSTVARYYANDVMTVGGYAIDQGLPWIVAAGGDGAWAFQMKKALMGTVNIAGVTALIDINHVADPIKLAPAGEQGDVAKITYFVSVGGGDSNSAVTNLLAVNNEPIPGLPYTQAPLSGTVKDASGGAAIAGALVELQAKNARGEWRVLDSFVTGADGSFAGQAADFGTAMAYRLQARADGRPDPAPVDLVLPAAAPVAIAVGNGGTLAYDIKDDAGNALPAKILLSQNGSLFRRVYGVAAPGSLPLPPGDYDITVTRGFEYTTFAGTILIQEGVETRLPVTLNHAVDTTGWLSTDAHEHAGPSADNRIPIPDRIRTAAGEGLDVAVSTDHEFIDSWQAAIDETGLGAWVATVVGQEVTASIPEHTNIYGGLTPRYDIDARGGYVKWFGKDIAEIYALERDRGAKVVQLNHPHGYIEMIGYDRKTGVPTLNDPTGLGLRAGAALWDWGFDVVEYQNGPAAVFGGGHGMFDYWMSFLNLGHRVTAMGNSDAHDWETVGTPRDYFPAASDDPLQFKEDELVEAVTKGRIVVSTGAFARVKVNGTAGPGDLLTTADAEVDLAVHIEAIPGIDVTHFKVYVNCDQVATVAAADQDKTVKYDGTVKVPIARDSHIVVLGFGKNPLPKGLSQFDATQVPRFTANAIYVDHDGNGAFDAPGGKDCTYDLNGP